MNYRTLTFALLSLLFFAACSNQNERYYSEEEMGYYNQQQSFGQYNEEFDAQPTAGPQEDFDPRPQQNNTVSTGNKKNGKVIMHSIKNPKTNSVEAQIPLPANWKIVTPTQSNPESLVGPNGIKAAEYQYQSFMYVNDPYTAQMYQANGVKMQKPKGVNAVLQQDILPAFKKEGLRLIKQYNLPEIAQYNKSYNDRLWKVAPMQANFEALGSEWADDKGNSYLVIINYNTNQGQGMTQWGYGLMMLEAPTQHFEAARKAYIYGMSNKQFTDAHFAAFNQKEQQRAYTSNNAHQQKMRQNQQHFDKMQSIHRSTNDAVNNSMMSTYNNNNASSDKSHSAYINSINEESTVTNPYDGQQYQVESGANQYWMNNNGEYIQSNDYNYNPNQDQNYYNYDWQQVEPQY